MAQTSKLTEKYQATIPADVRMALGLKKGDIVAFDIARGEVRLRRATPVDLAYAQALTGTLSEWDSKEDERAFRDL
ncbi:MAG: AbrB/MazE/SpoVT family DNA-binding domain-containing protein [Betaproteobacteria bacterium]|nr:AbrB/MazE/SpoVT family DNA-binding domain-containing protein [Betaproteobacteria bacterium]